MTNKPERLHSLDSLRAIMMLLGLVLHSAITYGTIEYDEITKIEREMEAREAREAAQ